MERLNENDARFLVKHQVTEDKILHLEKGIRKLGFASGGRSVMLFCVAVFAACAVGSRLLSGLASNLAAVGAVLSALIVFFGGYALYKNWKDTKENVHRQYESGKVQDNYNWEYRFYDDCYETIGKYETARAKYSHIGRLLDLSGMYVLVEKGNMVQYFVKQDVTKGDGEELGRFLSEKCGLPVESVKVRD